MMKRWLVLVLNLAVAGSLRCVGQEVLAGTKSADPMVIAISGPDHPLPSFSPAPIDVTITNSSNQDLQIEDIPGVTPSYDINVYDSAGKPLPKRALDKDQNVFFTRRVRILKAGHEWKEELLLSGYYDLTQPGEYTVQLVAPGNVASNIIKIDIVAGSLPPGSTTLRGVQSGPQVFDLGIVGPPVVKAGSPIKVRVGLRNVSEQDIVIPEESEGKAEFDYSVEVTDEQGLPVFRTEYGKNLSDRKLSMPATLWKSVSLHPEQVVTDQITVTDLFDLTRPGKYLISVSRRDELSSWNRIASRPRLVTVVP